jgi:hypothetical protein
MSGSAALSAAKRRRGGSEVTPQSQPQPRSDNVKSSAVQLTPLQILNQHHNKLDLLYKRQERINTVLNITDDADVDSSIIDRLDNVEGLLNIDSVKKPSGLVDTNNQLNEYAEQIKELKDIIMNVQAHSIKVSLELANIKMEIHSSSDNMVEDETAAQDETASQDETTVIGGETF